MKYYTLFIAILLHATQASATILYTCYEYAPDSYTLTHNVPPSFLGAGDGDDAKILDTKKHRLFLVSPNVETKWHERRVALINQESYQEDTGFLCPSVKSHPQRLYCEGEDDFRGMQPITIEPDRSINIKKGSLMLEDGARYWIVTPKDGATLPKPRKVTCPKKVQFYGHFMDELFENKERMDDAVAHAKKPARYVCYRARKVIHGKKVYEGCRYTRFPCKHYDKALKRFGRYKTERETLRAFARCRGVNKKQNAKSKPFEKFSIKKVHQERLPPYKPPYYEPAPLSRFGLSGKNKQKSYIDARRTHLPKAYKKLKKVGVEIMDRTKEGWIILNSKKGVIVHTAPTIHNHNLKVFFQAKIKEIVKEKAFSVDDMRYEDGILYFNAACPSYAKEQKGACSTLYAYDTKQDLLRWESDYLTSRNMFILTENLVIAGYGFTKEPDYLYILRKIDGKVLAKVKLDSAHDYLEMQGNRLHVITYKSHYVFKLSMR